MNGKGSKKNKKKRATGNGSLSFLVKVIILYG